MVDSYLCIQHIIRDSSGIESLFPYKYIMEHTVTDNVHLWHLGNPRVIPKYIR